ncbi:MAG TPA: DNA polymerase III subunit delta' [Candidatus Omnitrophota bacterium]|nr:DNA polymerase III subunit delta' [Candidatus Omnitrophota bacterium]HPD84783.1 DNA polymerase III subunit delta' [Candidatus Omnitrophota bacterium]HRZ03641.1 DNA polymerase III subunit delta' [Candidatus Omnitrophota bacterium]
MISKNILHSEVVLKRFETFIKTDCLAHAYLFCGPVGIGKSETALSVAKLIFCQNRRDGVSCGTCPACLKVNSGSHPDVHMFEAVSSEEAQQGLMRPKEADRDDLSESRSIRIEQIRHLNARMQLRPFEANTKIFILKDIENLSLDAANALLKTLEEPSADTLLLLTTSQTENVLETIRSRCQTIQFFPLGAEKLEECLAKEGWLRGDALYFLSIFSEGSLGKARKLDEENIFKTKNETINQFVYSRESNSYIDAVCEDAVRARETLKVLLTWFRDLMFLKLNVDRVRVVHRDRLNDLQKLQSRYSFEELEGIVREIMETSKLLEENLNIKVALTLVKERLWRG